MAGAPCALWTNGDGELVQCLYYIILYYILYYTIALRRDIRQLQVILLLWQNLQQQARLFRLFRVRELVGWGRSASEPRH